MENFALAFIFYLLAMGKWKLKEQPADRFRYSLPRDLSLLKIGTATTLVPWFNAATFYYSDIRVRIQVTDVTFFDLRLSFGRVLIWRQMVLKGNPALFPSIRRLAVAIDMRIIYEI
jgi:hypothetical protein